jgi:invasion protein IalB
MADIANQRFSVRMPTVTELSPIRIALRAGLALALLIAGGVIALVGERLLGSGNPAGANEVRVTPFQDWRVICSNAQGGCTLNSDVLRDTGGSLVGLLVNDPAPGSTLAINVPHGVMLDSGLGFSIGDEPMRVRPYEACNANGCFAFVTMDGDTIKSLSTNMAGQVVVVPGNGTPVTIPFSLKGFAEGYAELQRASARRTSIFSFLGR